jgi:hypothetical protein
MVHRQSASQLLTDLIPDPVNVAIQMLVSIEKQKKDQRSIDATTNGMLFSAVTLCVAPSAGLVMTRSSIPVSRGIVRASAAVANA